MKCKSLTKLFAALLSALLCLVGLGLRGFDRNAAYHDGALADTNLTRLASAGDGRTYRIEVFCPDEAGIPDGARLHVEEITPDTSGLMADAPFGRYLDQARRAIGAEAGPVTYARFFDITILDENGQAVEPVPGSQVDVRIELARAGGEPLSVVHFGDEIEVLQASSQPMGGGCALSFKTGSFSVYGIIEAPEPPEITPQTVQDVSELNGGDAFYISYGSSPKYISGSLNGNSAFVEVSDYSNAAAWYFEPAGSDYYIYTYIDGVKNYLKNTSGNLAGLSTAPETAMTVTPDGAGRFLIKVSGANKWLQHSGSGNGVRFYTDHNNAANSQLALTYVSSTQLEDDPYDLDGKTYGIAYSDDTSTAVGMSATEITSDGKARLQGVDMTIRTNVLGEDGLLLEAVDADVPLWTFHNVAGAQYYITTQADGQTKYLTIANGEVTLRDQPDPVASFITVSAGTGANAGNWHFTANGQSLNCLGTAARGFSGATGSGAATWMKLMDESVLTDDDIYLYSAEKVSLADRDQVPDGAQVVIYTRVWNDAEKQYEFYIVDHDGRLIQCYDTGDGIEWFGTQVNTALWDFTEYLGSDSNPNYYYELQNVQYGKYIAPQVTGGQILSGKTIGLHLFGRQYGRHYSTITAWDDRGYAYVGLKVENGRVVASPLSQADDFYFAIMSPVAHTDTLTTVSTVDNDDYGITMRMIDFNNPIRNGRDSVQTDFFGGSDNNQAGLLSTDLQGDGYPNTTSATGSVKSLSELYSGSDLRPANHLFLTSIYNESGYFEYNSTQNFARLNDDGTFTVYDQIAAIGTSAGPTRVHGQFMPFNDLVEGRYATVTNQTDVLQHELPDLNPRKGEKLYLIPQNEADYFFGMELSASFTQTPSGLDAWGHDIIFEFSGDDDFWLYVDGELVLDLGGVHSAMTGSVNFRTGVIHGRDGVVTSLYDVFRSNYQARGMSEAEIQQRLDEQFTQNEDGQWVFRDYSNHEMKIFYMERGAGASNLHMRFNLAAVKPGTFLLKKTLSGTDEASNDLIEFPYQIWYKTMEDGESAFHLLEPTLASGEPSVLYQGTSMAVPYRDSYTPASGSAPYSGVFLLKPGERAEVTLPEGATVYYVIECAVNPDIYDEVKVNGARVEGTATDNLINGTARLDFATGEDTLAHRAEVEYDNHVREGAMRTLEITKRLFDVDGVTPLHYPDDSSLFSFRLYLGNEDADPASLPLAFLYDYCVKDPDGFYCYWDEGLQRFVSLGKNDYSSLTEAEKEAATFATSMYGSITKIPADHAVEVRNLILGTRYGVEERNYEVPRGYTLRQGDGYTRVDVAPEETTGDAPYTGTIMRDESPAIEVRNQKGWGLTVGKVWTDKDFMQSHDPVYFAVFVQTDEGLSFYEDSVRQLGAGDTEIYYFFMDLVFDDYTYGFDDFVIREVDLTGEITVENGVVTGYDAPPVPIDEGGTLHAGGVPIGRAHEGYDYQVSYEQGETTGNNANIRTDVATNSRPGIPLYKIDENGDPLEAAVFTITDEEGRDFAAPSYASDAEGLITIAYLPQGRYLLTEIEAPEGYVVLDEPLTVTVDEAGQVTVEPQSDLIQVAADPAGRMMAVITVQDRPTGFYAKKVDADTLEPLTGVHFELYLQVTDHDGHQRPDYQPMDGYTDLVTNENGIIPDVTMDLGPGTYYLRETETLPQYRLLSGDDEFICFTIGVDGTVTMQDHPEWLDRQSIGSGNVSYSLVIPNRMPGQVSVTVSGTKIMKGRSMAEGEFAFTLTPIDLDGHAVDGAEPMIAVCPAGEENQAVAFQFEPLAFDMSDYLNAAYADDAGAYFYYVVAEVPGEHADALGYDSQTHVAYDLNRFLVVVRLSAVEGELTATQSAHAYDGDGVPAALRPAQDAAP